jgi:hypothetical protein
VFVELEIATP